MSGRFMFLSIFIALSEFIVNFANNIKELSHVSKQYSDSDRTN